MTKKAFRVIKDVLAQIDRERDRLGGGKTPHPTALGYGLKHNTPHTTTPIFKNHP